MGGPGPKLSDSEAGITGSSGASVGNRMGRRQLPTATHCSQMTGWHSTGHRSVLGFLSGLPHCLWSGAGPCPAQEAKTSGSIQQT